MERKSKYFFRDVFLYFYFPALLLCLLAWFMQAHFLLSGDVGYLLYAMNSLLKGGVYGAEIMESNPPIILYFYLPVCLLTKIGFPLLTTFRVYILLLIFLSLSCCYSLLKKIITSNGQLFLTWVSIAIILLFMPFNQFGQREHLLLIFIFPYLFATVLFLQNKPIYPLLAFFIGLIAGAVFALKPFFLITPLLIESYVIFYKKHWLAWLRIETLTILSVLIIYIYSILIFQPEYINIILPIVKLFYFVGIKQTWKAVFLNYMVFYCLVIICGCYIFRKNDQQPLLHTILLLALIGLLFAAIIPRAPWFYHVLPAFGLALVLVLSFYSQLIFDCYKKLRIRDENKNTWMIFSLTLLLYLVFLADIINKFTSNFGYQATAAKIFVAFYFLIYFIHAVLRYRQAPAFLSLGVVIIAFFLCINLWTSLFLILQISVIIGLLYYWLTSYSFFNSQQLVIRIYYYFCLINAGLFLLLTPIVQTILITKTSIDLKENSSFTKLVSYIKTMQNKQSIMCFSANTSEDCFPLVYATNSDYGSNSAFFWWLKGLKKLNDRVPSSQVVVNGKNYLFAGIADELNRYQAKLIIINTKDMHEQLNENFDFIHFFSENSQFREAWKHYHYLTTIDSYQIYKRST